MPSQSTDPVVISFESNDPEPGGTVPAGSFWVDATIPRRPGWKVRALLVPLHEMWEVQEVRVIPHDPAQVPAGGITRVLLRDVQVAALPRLLAASLPRGALAALTAGGPSDAPAWLTEGRRTGRRGRDSRFYAHWAALYVDRAATTETPVAALSDEMHISVETIRGYLGQARRRKLLTDPPPGRAGGSLTPKARQILTTNEGANR
jgi:hypothetical protein